MNITTFPQPSSRDWAEDFDHENGSYANTCVKCDKSFMGHKRRVICKSCQSGPKRKYRPMTNTIHLPIKRQWMNYITDGVNGDFKTEEYREDKAYWGKQLMGKDAYAKWVASGKSYPPKLRPGLNEAILHYYRPHKVRIELLGIEYKRPNPAWCPPETEGLWFALKLGDILETKNIDQ